jgi:hypothetical protein
VDHPSLPTLKDRLIDWIDACGDHRVVWIFDKGSQFRWIGGQCNQKASELIGRSGGARLRNRYGRVFLLCGWHCRCREVFLLGNGLGGRYGGIFLLCGLRRSFRRVFLLWS